MNVIGWVLILLMRNEVFFCLDFGGCFKSFVFFFSVYVGFGVYDVIILLFFGGFVFVYEVIFDGGDEFGEFRFVFGVDFGEGNDSSGLKVC